MTKPHVTAASAHEHRGLLEWLKQLAEKIAKGEIEKNARPAAELVYLQPMIGSFAGTMTTWLVPGGKPDPEPVKSTTQWVLGGRFLHRTLEGRFLKRPFAATAYTGFDDSSKEFVATWMDTASTGIVNTSGTADDTTRVFTLYGSIKDFMGLRFTVDVKTVLTIIDDDRTLHEVYIGPGLDLWYKAHKIELARCPPGAPVPEAK